jgi:tetratricopeptide (TPR) repeat protein
VPQHTLANVFCQLRGAENSREADDTVKAVERTETADRLVTAATPGSPLLHLRVLLDLAESYRVAARSREADAAFSRAQDRLTALGYDQTETAETLFNNWALVLWELGRPLDAEALYRRAIAISSADGTDARVSAFVLNNLGRTLEELGRYDEAIDYSTRAYEKGRVAGNDVVIMQSLLARAASYRKRGHLAQAAQALDEVDRRANGRWGPTHPGYVSLTLERADLARARGELDEAARLFDRVIAVMETRPDKYALPRALLRRATLSLERRQAAAARVDAENALAIFKEVAGPDATSGVAGRAALLMGRALLMLGREGEAHEALNVAAAHLTAFGANHPDSALAHELLSQVGVRPGPDARRQDATAERNY